jgi:hypothetical protein
LKRVGTDQLVAEHALERVDDDRAASPSRRNRHAINALVGSQANHADLSIGGAAPQTVTPEERRLCAALEDIEGLYLCDAQIRLPAIAPANGGLSPP